MVADDRLPYEQALEHQQPDRLAAADQRAPRRPAPARHLERAREQPLADLAHAPRVQPAGELRVGFEELN